LEFNVPFQHKYGYIRDDPGHVIQLQILRPFMYLERVKQSTLDWSWKVLASWWKR